MSSPIVWEGFNNVLAKSKFVRCYRFPLFFGRNVRCTNVFPCSTKTDVIGEPYQIFHPHGRLERRVSHSKDVGGSSISFLALDILLSFLVAFLGVLRSCWADLEGGYKPPPDFKNLFSVLSAPHTRLLQYIFFVQVQRKLLHVLYYCQIERVFSVDGIFALYTMQCWKRYKRGVSSLVVDLFLFSSL
jgi:hypothetical protein